MVTPRYLYSATCSSWLSQSIKSGVWIPLVLSFDTIIYLHLLGFKWRFPVTDVVYPLLHHIHIMNIMYDPEEQNVICKQVNDVPIAVWSPYRVINIYYEQRGPNTEPWRSPDTTWLIVDFAPFRITNCFLFNRYKQTHRNRKQFRPIDSSLSINALCGTESKDFCRSKETAQTSLPWSMAWDQLCILYLIEQTLSISVVGTPIVPKQLDSLHPDDQ